MFPSLQRRTVRSTWRVTPSVASPQEEGQSAGGTVPHRGRSSLDFQVSGASTSPRPPACLTATPSLTTASTPSWPTTRLLAVSAREVPSIQISQDSFQPRHRIVYLQGIAIVPARRRRLIIKSALLTVVITQIFSLTQCRLGHWVVFPADQAVTRGSGELCSSSLVEALQTDPKRNSIFNVWLRNLVFFLSRASCREKQGKEENWKQKKKQKKK